MSFVRDKFSAKFFLFFMIALLLIHVPIVGNYVRVINTLIHETGHALIGLLGGNVETISLFMNSEGATISDQSTWIGSFFTSLAGYTFASFIAIMSLYLLRKKKEILLIDILLAFIFLNLIFWCAIHMGYFGFSPLRLFFCYY